MKGGLTGQPEPFSRSDEISAVDARECIEYVIIVNRRLGVMLSQFEL